MVWHLEDGFHPHDPLSSPLALSTSHFRENMHIPLITCALYIGAIAYGHHFMKSREAWHLKHQLAMWNLGLALFSVVGAYKTAPLLARKVLSRPLVESICVSPARDWGAGASGLWVQLFVVSKFAELLDTAFIVLRKRKLLFLHWYHHFTVLLYCWHAYATEAPHALYFVAMNYCVHAIMYLYYAMMAWRVTILPPEIITAAQIAQMVVGVAVQVSATAVKHSCPMSNTNLLFGALMYASYLALFVNFALKRFVYGKYKRGELLKDAAGMSRPASLRVVFPVTSRIIERLATKMKRTISGTFAINTV